MERTVTDPERYVRINISQNSKGFTYETTVSLRWTGEQMTGEEARVELERLGQDARVLAQDEIARREREG